MNFLSTLKMSRRPTQPAGAKKRTPAQGESSQQASRDKKSDTVTVSLRIPVSMLKEIDRAVKGRPYRMPRHMWLLEAIHEKLTRLRQPKTEQS